MTDSPIHVQYILQSTFDICIDMTAILLYFGAWPSIYLAHLGLWVQQLDSTAVLQLGQAQHLNPSSDTCSWTAQLAENPLAAHDFRDGRTNVEQIHQISKSVSLNLYMSVHVYILYYELFLSYSYSNSSGPDPSATLTQVLMMC